MPDAAADPGPDRIHHVVNGRELKGRRNPRTGLWAFESADWPELARRFNGSADVTTIVAAFHARAIAQQSPWLPADVI